MKFEKAYCEELNDCINPYEARDLYFSNDSNYYMRKLTFHCPSEHCRVPLLPVAIYRKEKTKTKIHFRTKSLNNHIISPKKCDFYYNIDQDFTSEVNAKKSNHKKKSVLPSEFLLVKPIQLKKTLRKVEDTMNINNNVNRVTRSKSTGSITKGSSNVKTPYFEQIIDCYENNDPNTLKTETLTINGKKKSYSSFFKKCEYFLDEEGLIYWGEVTKLKKYGNNYRVKFKKKVRVNEKGLEITIYLNSDLIQSYNKKNQLLEVLDKLTTFNGEIRCYFVGVYPTFEKVTGKGNEFEVISVKIENLDHLVFRFDFEVEE
ncbi:hypothetical protein BS614_23420 [Paenibacillus xylanexedens]|uniref:hypothetical protein n=1 Tax=Paenibacillus xylanexedens TaxID=528191 RepID=UPI0009384EA2|nr:hypothetical protein [Paenibacillus xylanexedens]APO46700.1 hypothetical protein BS614_23420 [Paenibacillus xylanexedens]